MHSFLAGKLRCRLVVTCPIAVEPQPQVPDSQLKVPKGLGPEGAWGSQVGRGIAQTASWSHGLSHTGWHFLDEAHSPESCKTPVRLVLGMLNPAWTHATKAPKTRMPQPDCRCVILNKS